VAASEIPWTGYNSGESLSRSLLVFTSFSLVLAYRLPEQNSSSTATTCKRTVAFLLLAAQL